MSKHPRMESELWLKELDMEQLRYDLARLIYTHSKMSADTARPLAIQIILLFKKNLEGKTIKQGGPDEEV